MSRVPRLRMFAGPNGSGKSTIKSVIRPELLGVYINPDDIEDDLRAQGYLDLGAFGISTTHEVARAFFRSSELLNRAQQRGLRTYLYYVATEVPIINISRVRNRVRLGGHPVPEDKIVSRYGRSLSLLAMPFVTQTGLTSSTTQGVSTSGWLRSRTGKFWR